MDSRKLNQHIVNDCQKTQPIDDILQKFSGKKYLTTLDLTQGFLQVEVEEASRKYLAFTFNGNNYQFKRLPFGTCVSTPLFIKAMNQVLGPEVADFVTGYVDDILITSSTCEEHLKQIEIVLKKFEENGVTVKIKKSEFFRKEVKFLGYIITDQGIKVDEEKIEKILQFKTPRNLKKLQSFLGLCNYYRKFKVKYSDLTGRFAPVLSSKSVWKWGQQEQENFENIKRNFVKSVMLKHPDFEKPFYLSTDASDISVSAVLYQKDNEDDDAVICFGSRTLLTTERAYSVTEKELLAVVFACRKFRTYLIGHPRVIVQSDHRALSFLKTCRLTHGKLLRWVLVLQEFN